MRIGFIGAGRVGFTFGKYLVERDMCVSGYYSRNRNSSKEAAAFTKTKYYETIEELVKVSDTLILTVPDGSIREVYLKVIESDIEGKILCHCSGMLSSEVFSGIRERGAFGYSVHPIYAVSDRLTSYQGFSRAYFTIEGDERRLQELKDMIASLGNPVEIIRPEAKARYHGAAVFASNFVAGIYDCAKELLLSCGLSAGFAENALRSLFLDGAKNIADFGVEAALTGPVERADLETVQSHLGALGGEEREIYRLLSKRLLKIAERKNPDRDYGGFVQALREKSF